jgi:hypothetical protein
MADKSTISRAFNTHLLEFLDDIIRIYPENQDVTKAKTSFETIKKANPSLIVKAWFQKVYTPYQQIIDAGDISFFFDKDYSQDLQSVSNAGEIMNMIDKIREPVRTMNDENKDHCMKYIQNLSKLSTVYSAM